jgi:hypothetical protein
MNPLRIQSRQQTATNETNEGLGFDTTRQSYSSFSDNLQVKQNWARLNFKEAHYYKERLTIPIVEERWRCQSPCGL